MAHDAASPTDPVPDLGREEDEELVKVHPPARRVVALVIAGCLLAMTLLAAGFSLLRAPPFPSRTRPLPPLVPSQGALR
jgi:hypothetical protein